MVLSIAGAIIIAVGAVCIVRRRRREKTMIENMITPTPFGDTPDDKLEGKYDKSHSKWNEESALD